MKASGRKTQATISYKKKGSYKRHFMSFVNGPKSLNPFCRASVADTFEIADS
jgi:hypothetical protein